MNANYQGSVFKGCLFKYSTNTISPTDAKQSNGKGDMGLWTSPGVLVRDQFRFVLVDYSDEYVMKSQINKISGKLNYSFIWMTQYVVKTR
jgi:hypothetical protein